MPTPTQSPGFILPPIDLSTLKYDFFEALKAVAAGEKITRLEWNDERFYGCLYQDQLMIHKPDVEYEYYPWTVSYADMIGTDWVVVP